MDILTRTILFLALLSPAAANSQSRVASLNLCLDQVLLQWAPPESIVSITWLSAQDQYRSAPVPEHVYLNRAQAEELLPLKPDLVLTGQFGAQRAAARLEALGFTLVRIPDAYSLEQLQVQLQALQDTLGALPALVEQRAQLTALLAESEDKYQQKEKSPEQPTALILSANNITYGSGMLEHQLLTRAGFRNLAAEQGVQQLGRVSLEQVVALQPDLLVFYGGDQDFAIAHLAERHPVVQRYFDRGRTYHLPRQLGYCPALAAVETLQQLKNKRSDIVGKE
ncbi:ABC transporter substrate-binding protein [Microbulbifer hydrolyticus]|uniref:ABC transporter substrate-binding protein n=1 Tax=Microbulbifer hydrolyticus TaxID=48074 RepID=A0A6P1TF72_9GAMM|nr:ABC transporter substrate-binding protein [Microbulbifer hydrolyticus]MBB5212690.1 iron complex transport system substrate-binding protein [Microbulbifer hydrolyticus]QHQ40285.1 ABC transporter substrate-binding protein [Microbulbifer hydrolyticus]